MVIEVTPNGASEEQKALRQAASAMKLGRPLMAATGLRTSALSTTERATLTVIAAALAAELLRAERLHVSPVLQLNRGVSGTTAANEVDRVRREAREELSKAAAGT
jgi:hypothetical protein